MTQENSNVLAVSNQVSTANITMAVALAITLWRLKDSPARRRQEPRVAADRGLDPSGGGHPAVGE